MIVNLSNIFMWFKSTSLIVSIIIKYLFKRKHMNNILENFNKINSNIIKLNPKRGANIVAISKTFHLNT